ncbi:hypothetical protein BN1723_013939 [Verticillium longisporum]|uniref:Uncharacterized protein n=1 Tax=Verticillium longisporum TaxID=100787 RepID=A0A0G4LYQ6_VERLO|nr:hypothetical protein BN1708_013159 [Verticillium longisporum]CRK27142.1 hypothetical protein BN1723_013939 [Verticillium longisporum]
MTTLSPPLHPASLDVGTATAPLEEYTAEAVRRAAEALIQIRAGDSGDAGDSGNAVEPSQQCLSPSIIQDNVTQVSEAWYDGDSTLSAAQDLHDALWASFSASGTPFGLTDSIPCGACSDAASAVCDICPRNDGCDDTVSQQLSWDILDTTQIDSMTQSIDFTSFTPPDVCLAEWTLDLDREPLDAASLEDAFAQLETRRRAEQALSSSATPTSPTRRRTRQRASNQQRTPQQRGAGKEFFLASAVAFQTDNHELVFTPQRRSRVWVSEAGPARIELEPESLPETPRWIDVHPGGVASYAVRLSWHADLELLCGLDEIRGMTLAISREMAQDLLLAIGESHQFDSEALKLLSKGLTE